MYLPGWAAMLAMSLRVLRTNTSSVVSRSVFMASFAAVVRKIACFPRVGYRSERQKRGVKAEGGWEGGEGVPREILVYFLRDTTSCIITAG